MSVSYTSFELQRNIDNEIDKVFKYQTERLDKFMLNCFIPYVVVYYLTKEDIKNDIEEFNNYERFDDFLIDFGKDYGECMYEYNYKDHDEINHKTITKLNELFNDDNVIYINVIYHQNNEYAETVYEWKNIRAFQYFKYYYL